MSNALNYSTETATSPDGPWGDQRLSTKTTVPIGDLTPGTVYWARVCANGASGSSDWSVPTTAMAV